MNDYRNTDYCKTLCDIHTKKEEFKKQMIKDHPRMTNYYRYISEKGGPYKRQFIELYNAKCVYCGNSLDNITIELFEIDHFINEASFQGADKKNAHKIPRLHRISHRKARQTVCLKNFFKGFYPFMTCR